MSELLTLWTLTALDDQETSEISSYTGADLAACEVQGKDALHEALDSILKTNGDSDEISIREVVKRCNQITK